MLQTLALDLLHYLPSTDAAILKAITLLCSTQALQSGMQQRAIDNLAGRGTAGEGAEGERLRAFLLGVVVDPWPRPCSSRDDYALLDCAATALAGLPSGVQHGLMQGWGWGKPQNPIPPPKGLQSGRESHLGIRKRQFANDSALVLSLKMCGEGILDIKHSGKGSWAFFIGK